MVEATSCDLPGNIRTCEVLICLELFLIGNITFIVGDMLLRCVFLLICADTDRGQGHGGIE